MSSDYPSPSVCELLNGPATEDQEQGIEEEKSLFPQEVNPGLQAVQTRVNDKAVISESRGFKTYTYANKAWVFHAAEPVSAHPNN